jgi:hypothetical protein
MLISPSPTSLAQRTDVSLFTPLIHNPWVTTFTPSANRADGTTRFFHCINFVPAAEPASPREKSARGAGCGIVNRVIGGDAAYEVNVEDRDG